MATASSAQVPRLVVRQSSDVPDGPVEIGRSRVMKSSASSRRNSSALQSRSSSYADVGKVQNDQTLHIPSSTATHNQSQSDSLGSTASRETSIDGADLSGSRAGLDPVTQLVLKRTVPSGGTFRPSTEFLPDKTGDGGYVGQDGQRLDGAVDDGGGGDSGQPREREKEKRSVCDGGAAGLKARNRVSFLSRLVGNKRKDNKIDNESIKDAASEPGGDTRPEGADAQPFSQPVDNFGYSPKSPLPPSYIKIRAKNKKGKADFDRIFLAQQLEAGVVSSRLERRLSDVRLSRNTTAAAAAVNARTISAADKQPVWTMEFSKDGKYLAAAGQSRVIRVWAVLSTPEERRAHEKAEHGHNSYAEGERLSAPVFHQKVYREFVGHTSTILDLSWSKNNFLLSSSMDKTVRLWHVSLKDCLCTFKHSDFVPSIRFHPKDDRFFLAGSLDSKLRLWSIPDKSVAYWSQLPEMITAVSFTPDGKTAIAGCLDGMCVFYDTDGLKYQTQIQVRSNHGKNAKGSKITGIQTAFFPPGDISGEVKILISSNDSRIRLYNLRDKSMELKFKGHENNYSQIRAAFTDDGRYVICGSEDRKVFIWPTVAKEAEKQDKRPVENFEAHNTITTSAVLAPTRTRQLLSASEDPLFDVCNPPPVMLVDKAESVASSKPPTDNNGNGNGNENDGIVQATTPATTKTSFNKANRTPAYVSRTTHPGGHIVVTADYAGAIKVFRQDCAFKKRRPFTEAVAVVAMNGDHGIGGEINGSTSLLSKRMTAGLRSRPASTSASSTPVTGGGAFHRGAGMIMHAGESISHPHLPTSDRIQSWRHSVHGFASSSIDKAQSHGSLQKFGNTSDVSSQRNSMSQVSMSSLRNGHTHSLHNGHNNINNKNNNNNANPSIAFGHNDSTGYKSSEPLPSQPLNINTPNNTRSNDASQFRKEPKPNAKSSPKRNRRQSSTSTFASTSSRNNNSTDDGHVSQSQLNSQSENPLWIQGEQSYLFWDKHGYKTQVEAAHRGMTGSGDLGSATDGSFDSIGRSNNINGHGRHNYENGGSEDQLLSSSAATERPGMLGISAAGGSAAGRFRNGIRQPSEVSVLSSALSDLSDSAAGAAAGDGGEVGDGIGVAGEGMEDEQFVDAPDALASEEREEGNKKR